MKLNFFAYFFGIVLALVFCSSQSEFKVFVPNPESSIRDLAAEKNITKMWTLGPVTTLPGVIGIVGSDELFDLPLPQKEDETYMLLLNIDQKNSETLDNLQVRLFINKLLTNDKARSTYLISRYFAVLNSQRNEILSDFDLIIGRISTEKDLLALSVEITKDGTWSLQKTKNQGVVLEEFIADTTQKIKISKENSSTFPTNKITELKLGHAYPAVVSCITQFGGLGSFARVKDCTQESLDNTESSNRCDQSICRYYGFSEKKVAEQLAFEKKDHSPSSVSCRVNVPKFGFQGQGTNTTNFLKTLTGQDTIATTAPPGALYKVPAADCSAETQKRACFNDTTVKMSDAAHNQQYALTDSKGNPLPVSKPCTGTSAEFVCLCSEGENCIFDYDKDGNTIGYGRETIVGPPDIRRSTQNRMCTLYKNTVNPQTGKTMSKQVRAPAYASCINESLLKISTPESCALPSNLQVDCKLNRYNVAPFTVPVASCNSTDIKEACTPEATPISGSCRVRN